MLGSTFDKHKWQSIKEKRELNGMSRLEAIMLRRHVAYMVIEFNAIDGECVLERKCRLFCNNFELERCR